MQTCFTTTLAISYFILFIAGLDTELEKNIGEVKSFSKIISLLHCSLEVNLLKGKFLIHVYDPNEGKHH